jgi:hypothetical protein
MAKTVFIILAGGVGVVIALVFPTVMIGGWIVAFVIGVFACDVSRWLHESEYASTGWWDWFRLKTVYRNTDVRLSVSALVRIKIGDNHLLVKSSRIEGQYQPVGGLFKFFEPARQHLNEFRTKYRTGYGYDQENDRDLRIHVPGRNVPSFVAWFLTGRDRELTPWREFYEELVETGILPADSFAWVNFGLVRTRFDRLHRSKHFGNVPELLIAQVFVPEFTTEQWQIIKHLNDTLREGDQYAFVQEDHIQTGGHAPSAHRHTVRVGDHTAWILEGAR